LPENTEKAIVKVDGTIVPTNANGQLDTTYLSNGTHTVTVEAESASGQKTTTTGKITVDNKLTPWQVVRNQLFAPLKGDKKLMDGAMAAALMAATLAVGGGGFWIWRRIVVPKLPPHRINTNL
jgi:hypothetical protein